jgi:phosphatidate cytidylyltransferase
MVKKRVITAVWGIPLLIAAIWFDKPLPWFTVLAAVWGVLAVYEFYRLVAAARVPPLTWFGVILTLVFILRPHFEYSLSIPVLLTSIVILPLVWLVLRTGKEQAFIGWAWTVAGIIYVGWLMSHLVALRMQDDGRNWVFLGLFVTIASDTSAFFIGKAVGRHHLAPGISPGKTWEGAIAGAVGAIIISLFFLLPTPFLLPLSYGQAILFG